MGRFTSAATQSSSNPNQASVSYAEATGTSTDTTRSTSSSSSSSSPNSGEAHAGMAEKVPKKRLIVPTVGNVSSSNAGASSASFHIYRRDRENERLRMEGMQNAHREKTEDAAYKKDMADKNNACEDRTSKKALKRKKRKQAQIAARKRAKFEKEEKKNGNDVPEVPVAAVGGATKNYSDRGINKNGFSNDGSFLAHLLKKE